MKCSHPIPVKNQKLNGRIAKLFAPCGKCETCLVKKKQQWMFTEHFNHPCSALFVTLTYSDSNFIRYRSVRDTQLSHYGNSRDSCRFLRVFDDSHYNCFGVAKADVQKFLKQLRKLHKDLTSLQVYLFRKSIKSLAKSLQEFALRASHQFQLFNISKFLLASTAQ